MGVEALTPVMDRGIHSFNSMRGRISSLGGAALDRTAQSLDRRFARLDANSHHTVASLARVCVPNVIGIRQSEEPASDLLEAELRTFEQV